MSTVDEAREALLPCPFCGGSAYHDRVERDGYEAFPDDPDRWSHVVRCRSCAAASGWSKSGPEGAARWWNMRTEAAVRAEREGLVDALTTVQGALNRLWSNGPAIDTIATLNSSWVNPDGDPTLYEQLRDLSRAVDATLATPPAPEPERCGTCGHDRKRWHTVDSACVHPGDPICPCDAFTPAPEPDR